MTATVSTDVTNRIMPPDQVKAFTLRYLRQMARSKTSLLFMVAWPSFWYFMISHFTLSASAQPASVMASLKGMYAISFGLFGAFTVVLNGFVGSFAMDLSSKRYRKFRSMPISPLADLTGRFLAGFLLASFSYLSLLVVGYLDGASFLLQSPFTIPVVVCSLFAFCVVGVVVALVLSSFVPKPEYASMMSMAVLLISFFATGLNGISPTLFPGPAWLLNYLPNTLATRIQIVYLVDFESQTPQASALFNDPLFFVLLLSYAVGCLVLGSIVMQRVVYYGERGEYQ